MRKRGPKPKESISTNWSSNLAYAVGLLASDGCLVKGSTLIDLTSKDQEQILNFMKCLDVSLYVGKKASGSSAEKKYWRVQFKNRVFYDFLISIGLTPAKSKTLAAINIPDEYFFDFLRGVFDGDGCVYSYWDPRWKSSFMFYIGFASASEEFVLWLQTKLKDLLGVRGHLTYDGRKRTIQLKYAKKESLKVIQRMFAVPDVICLSRKRLKIERILDIVGVRI